MVRMVTLYGVALALAAAALQWLELSARTRLLAPQFYAMLLATGFMLLGLWAGRRLTAKRPPGPFARNDAAIRSLGLTARECEILGVLTTGKSNKQLARDLGISPNTVKTHVARVYAKLEASGRVEAIEKARRLALIE